MKSTRFLVLSVSVIALASCASVPITDKNLPTPEMSDSWRANDQAAAAVRDGWLDRFEMAGLSDFVGEVLQNNHNYQATAYRMEAAGFGARVARGGLYPTLSGAFDASRSRSSNPTQTANSLSVGLDARWEVDVWGRLAALKEQGAADYAAARYDLEGARLSLAAQVAQTWFDVMEAQAQLDLALKTVDNFERTVRTVRNRYQRGLSTGLDLRLTTSNLEAARATLSRREDALAEQQRRLEVLAGRYPAAEITPTGHFPELEQDVPAGLPIDLLERRPDLQAAKARLLSVGYESQATGKNMLPKFSITASGSNTTNGFSDLLKFDNIFWNLLGNMTQPIFQGGKLRYAAKLQEARFEAEKEDFARTLLDAFKEVEDALSRERALKREVGHTAKAAANAVAAENVALDQYSRGLIKIAVLLESQRQSLNQQSQLLSVKNQRVNNRIALHLALGGDFTTSEDIQTQPTKKNAPEAKATKGNAL